VTIGRNTLTPKRRNFAHKTHRVFKRPKTTSMRRRSTTSRKRPASARR
jgi:hypothetical protein